MADFYAKGIINLSLLDKVLEENDGLVSTNEKGEMEVKININFYTHTSIIGRNMKIRAFLRKGTTFSIGSADVDIELLKQRLL